MTHFQRFLSISFFIILSVGSTLVWAEDYKEVSYDELLNQLSSRSKKSQNRFSSESLDDMKLHFGVGFISSANQVKINDRLLVKEQSGFQLSVGLDLFSENWTTEGVIRNLGQARSATEVRSLREYDLKVMFKDKLSAGSGYRFGIGLGNRYLRIADEAQNIFIDSATPAGVGFLGIDALINENVSFVFELGTRTALITDTVDKNSIDLSLNVVTNF